MLCEVCRFLVPRLATELMPPAVEVRILNNWITGEVLHNFSTSCPPMFLSFNRLLLYRLPDSYFQFSSVTQSGLMLCNPMNHSTPGLPVHHQHPEFTQTHVHQVSDAVQPSHPLWSPLSPAPNPSQHQSLF